MRWSMYLVKEEISRITFFNAEKQLLAVQIYLVYKHRATCVGYDTAGYTPK